MTTLRRSLQHLGNFGRHRQLPTCLEPGTLNLSTLSQPTVRATDPSVRVTSLSQRKCPILHAEDLHFSERTNGAIS